jgi:hypothetical protein
MLAVNLAYSNETRSDVLPFVQWLENDEPADGVMLFKINAPSHVHMNAPKYTPIELLRLLHVRLGHPSNAILAATCKKSVTTGHEFSRITKEAFAEFCKLGCSVCNKLVVCQS